MNDRSSLSLNEAKLERLYMKLEKPIYNVVYRWLWNAEEAHDVTQDAFLRLWKMRERVDIETVEPLVFRIAVNLAANRKRAQKLRRWIGLEAVEHEAAEGQGETDHAARERDALVRSAIDTLPEALRRVVIMCELSELSYREVALALGIPEGTVGSRRNKALGVLREKLAFVAREDVHVT